MKLDKIMKREDANSANIVLYRQGLFLRAYEISAYHLSTFCSFKVINKYIVYLKRDVVYSGFPESALDRIKLTAAGHGWGMSTHSEGVCFGKTQTGQPEAHAVQFEKWRQQHLLPLLPVEKNTFGYQIERSIIAKLKKFRVEQKTPFEALQFVMEIKQSLEQK